MTLVWYKSIPALLLIKSSPLETKFISNVFASPSEALTVLNQIWFKGSGIRVNTRILVQTNCLGQYWLCVWLRFLYIRRNKIIQTWASQSLCFEQEYCTDASDFWSKPATGCNRPLPTSFRTRATYNTGGSLEWPLASIRVSWWEKGAMKPFLYR